MKHEIGNEIWMGKWGGRNLGVTFWERVMDGEACRWRGCLRYGNGSSRRLKTAAT